MGRVLARMKAEILNAFYDAATNVLTQETGGAVRRTGLAMDKTEHVSDEVTIYVALVGTVRGMVLVGMSTATGRNLAGRMVGEPQPELTELGLSALAEVGNLVAGGATIELEKLGFPCDITPPTVMIGPKTRVSALGLPRFVIPLETIHGPMNIHVAVDARNP